MFGLSFTEVLLILAIALVVLGPDRLPGLAKALGRATREFRKATREIRATLEVEEVRRTLRERIDLDHQPSRVVKPGAPATPAVPDDLADKKKQLEPAATVAPAATGAPAGDTPKVEPAPAVPGAVEATTGPGAVSRPSSAAPAEPAAEKSGQPTGPASGNKQGTGEAPG